MTHIRCTSSRCGSHRCASLAILQEHGTSEQGLGSETLDNGIGLKPLN
jgi:hypothetical protein